MACSCWQVAFYRKHLPHFNVDSIYNTIYDRITKSYWEKKDQLSPETLDKVAWDSTGDGFQTLPTGLQCTIGKNLSHFCRVNATRQLRKELDHAECPCCNNPHETVYHVLQCQHSGAQDIWSQAMMNLTQWMEKNKTAPHLTQCIISNLNAWNRGKEATKEAPTTGRSQLQCALQEQHEFGWYNFLNGRLSKRSFKYKQNS